MPQVSDSPPTAAAPAAPPPARYTWAIRLVLVLLGLAAWFGTQQLISLRPYDGTIGDRVLEVLTPLHTWLFHNRPAANALLIASSAVIDLLGLYLLASAIFSRTIRPFVGLLMLFGLRQICQAVCVLPAPEGMIWHHPGFPSLLVTYGVSNDLFFSGHTALAVYGAIELGRRPGAHWKVLGVAIAFFEAFTVLALRAHWTMDVFAGAAAAVAIACIAHVPAGWLDRLTARRGEGA